ncbi:MAG TPA: hypothetical protein VFD58_11490 [Blastocatellia bacterium]|nr:hypothetical protein [Blastocatellia bacterium]
MFIARHFLLTLLFTALFLTTAPAQDPAAAGQQRHVPRTSIFIEHNLVRFTTPGVEPQQWRVEVFGQAGESVFDSDWVFAAALEWPLLDQAGQAVGSGLYAYTLTIKDSAGETTRTQRGHVIVNRAGEGDRVWVTSDSEVGVGAAGDGTRLTVTGSSDVTVAGVEVPVVPTRRDGEDRRGGTKRTGSDRAVGESPATPASGTPNQLAKFAADGTTLINSSVIETNAGDIGIGTAAPGGVFDLQRASASDILERLWNTGTGGAKLRYVAATGATSQLQFTDNAEWLMAIAGNKHLSKSNAVF